MGQVNLPLQGSLAPKRWYPNIIYNSTATTGTSTAATGASLDIFDIDLFKTGGRQNSAETISHVHTVMSKSANSLIHRYVEVKLFYFCNHKN